MNGKKTFIVATLWIVASIVLFFAEYTTLIQSLIIAEIASLALVMRSALGAPKHKLNNYI